MAEDTFARDASLPPVDFARPYPFYTGNIVVRFLKCMLARMVALLYFIWGEVTGDRLIFPA